MIVVPGLIMMLMAGDVNLVITHETKTVEGYDLTFGAVDEPLITGERIELCPLRICS